MTLQEAIAGLPSDTGVYIFKDSHGRVVYVGKAKNIRGRVRSHFRAKADPRHEAMVAETESLEFIVTASEVDALILEATLVKDRQPYYNVSLKDDKRYPYLKVTMGEEYPRLQLTRRVAKDGSRYFGPYTDVKALRRTMKLLRAVFPLRTCRDLEARRRMGRDCLSLHIKRCIGPCTHKVTREEYDRVVEELVLFLSGKGSSLLSRLREQMEEASGKRQYEKCALFRDRIEAVESVLSRQKVAPLGERETDVLGLAQSDERACIVVIKVRDGRVMDQDKLFLNCKGSPASGEILSSFIEQYYMPNSPVPERVVLPEAIEGREVLELYLKQLRGAKVSLLFPRRGAARGLLEMAQRNAALALKSDAKGPAQDGSQALDELQSALRLPGPPETIECYDISNTSGTSAVGSRAVFVGGKASKSSYRRYAIKGPAAADDTAMLHEVIARSLSRRLREGQALPDLIVVDGGKGQVSAALKAAAEVGAKGVRIIGLAKANEVVHRPGAKAPLVLPRSSSSLKLLQRLRDEAHRFGLAYHRARRGKAMLGTGLDAVKGLGPKRRALLLRKFGSAQAVAAAAEQEISSIPGMGKATARKIKAAIEAAQEGRSDGA